MNTHFKMVPALVLAAFWLAGLNAGVYAQQASEIMDLNDLSAFGSPTENWKIAGGVFMDLNRPLDVHPQDGTGILVNDAEGDPPQDIFTAWEHGDIDLELEVMMAKDSNSGIYLQGRYEIQLLDSWGVRNPKFGDMGGIYQWQENDRGTGGVPPRVNAARAPGLWQKLKIKFRAPRFNDRGEKIAHAKLVEVTLNGEVIHENVDLVHPTGGAVSNEEVPEDPLRFQGDHGPVAFRNITYKMYDDPLAEDTTQSERSQRPPMTKNPVRDPLLMHGFLRMENRVYPHSVAVGYPEATGVNFALDLNSGSLMKIWKGDFLDLSTMWAGRGGNNLSYNEEAAIALTAGAPSYAFLENRQAAWPDSLQPDAAYRFKHYSYDGDGSIAFSYELKGVSVSDRILPDKGGQRLSRTLEFSPDEPLENLYIRVISGNSISKLDNGIYQVDGNRLYVDVDDEMENRSWTRSTAEGEELLIAVDDNSSSSLTYSFIW